jgi:hypothetical protein
MPMAGTARGHLCRKESKTVLKSSKPRSPIGPWSIMYAPKKTSHHWYNWPVDYGWSLSKSIFHLYLFCKHGIPSCGKMIITYMHEGSGPYA